MNKLLIASYRPMKNSFNRPVMSKLHSEGQVGYNFTYLLFTRNMLLICLGRML